MKISKIICAEKVIKDVENEEFSFINIYDQIRAKSFPILLNRLSIYILAEKEKGDSDDIELAFSITNNDKTIFEDKNFLIKFNKRESIRTVIKFNGLPIEESGNLNFIFTSIDTTAFEYAKEQISLRLRETKIIE